MKDVVGYEGLYGITPEGEVYSYKRKKFLKPRDNKKGYLQVGLCKDGKEKNHLIHRLVAEAYIPNPENLPMINHKDENKSNNCLQNLEWCDNKYNCNYGTRNERKSDKLKKTVIQYDLDGNFIKEWKSATDVGREVRFGIYQCVNGKRKTAFGYIWKYKE